MKISLKHHSIQKQNSKDCVVTEHPLEDEAINFAIAQVAGRYPPQGYARNQKCKELVYVSQGRGYVVVNDEEHALQEGDSVLIEPGEKFYWKGELTLSISCTPAWTKDQFECINE